MLMFSVLGNSRSKPIKISEFSNPWPALAICNLLSAIAITN